MTIKNGMPPVHPGEILREDVLPALKLSVAAAAKILGCSPQFLYRVLKGQKGLSAEMCLKVAKLAGSTPEMWMRLQASYDLKKAAGDKKLLRFISGMKVPTGAYAAPQAR
jgi:addiction module HigA family antidote